jgi:hypothetical protein
VNKIFVSQPSNLGKGGSNPPRPLRLPEPPIYFGLPMATITTKQTYHRPLNYHEYAKDSDPYAHASVFKATSRANSETYVTKIVNMLSFTFKNIVYD